MYNGSFSPDIRIGLLLCRNVRFNRNMDLVLFVEEAEIISALLIRNLGREIKLKA